MYASYPIYCDGHLCSLNLCAALSEKTFRSESAVFIRTKYCEQIVATMRVKCSKERTFVFTKYLCCLIDFKDKLIFVITK
jgi:hypothetical protein